jgi:uncharacterized protein (DUF1015 family)
VRLEPYGEGEVYPHERTFGRQKAQRLELLRATKTKLSPIFLMHDGPSPDDPAAPPDIELDFEGVHVRLWRVPEPEATALAESVRTPLVIADGHHRYETALRYRDERREETGRRTGEEPFDYVLAYLVNMDEPGLVVLPTHRLLRDLPMEPAGLVERLRACFRVEEVARSSGARGLVDRMKPPASERRIGVVLRGEPFFFVLAARDGDNDARLSGSTALRRLDVTLLHGLVLEGETSILGLDAHREAEAGRWSYTKDEEEAVSRVESGEMAAAFLLNATRVDEVRAVSEAGETMPEKSTYFYPKIATGLVFNPLED